ncbi:MAG: SpoIIE family protein phosphatase [bacterium]|nr:SpoIIE family protein phosphatase [bacterium]
MPHRELLKLNADAILDSISDGVYVTDLDRRIIYWSKSAERITGWSREDMVGQTCYDQRLSHLDKDGHPLCGSDLCPLNRAIVTGEGGPVPMVVFARTRDGRRIPLRLSVAPIRGADGRIVGGVETFQDLSAQYDELAWAQRIQSMTLRRDLPDDPRLAFAVRYIPRDMVGGDFYAIQPIDSPDRGDGSYAFMLADIMGHGVAAALFTMQLHALWQENRALVCNPAASARRVSRYLHTLMKRDGAFATALFGRFDARAGRMVLVSAGNPYPFHFTADGGREIIRCSGLPLGLRANYEPEPLSLQLAGGDRMLFYTDGAIDVLDVRQRLLGVEGFMDVLLELEYPRGGVPLGSIEERLLKWSNEIRLRDDLTLLELNYRESAA